MANLSHEHEVTISEAAILVEWLIDAGDPAFIWGPPGCGKSSIVHQIGKRTGRKVIEYRANLREPVDLRGIPVADHKTGRTKWFVPDELPQAERDGERGILFLDELNTASPQMQAALFQLVLERRIGEYVLPDGWVIVAAGNRVSDRAAAQRMPTALRNRFSHLFVVPDVDAWCAWANANNVAPEAVAFVRLRRELIYLPPKGDENAFPTARSITAAAKHVSAPKSHRLRLFAAHIGDGPGAEFDGFVSLYHSIGSLEDIVRDPVNAKVPVEPSERYAICTGLARLATRKTLPNVITYAERLPRESQILVVTDATGRDESLKNTQAYTAWAIKNQDLTIQ